MTGSRLITAEGFNGTVTFDGDFVTVERSGLRAVMGGGRGTKRIPVVSLAAVHLQPAGNMGVNGFISFAVAGGREFSGRSGGQAVVEASRDENSIVFKKKQSTAFEELRAAVEQAIAQRHRPDAAAPQAPDALAQIEQLGKLRDAGVLSDDEFAEKKADLLRRL